LLLPQPKLGLLRLLSALACFMALAALFLLWRAIPAWSPEAAALSESGLAGAAVERVAKLEKDVSSLLLKMVTLEKDITELKNRNPNQARVTELGSRFASLQNQVNDLSMRLNALPPAPQEAAAPVPPAPQATAAPVPPAPQEVAAPAPPAPQEVAPPAPAEIPSADSQVESRAGNKPPPLAAQVGGESARPAGQPRERYVVRPGDTLFAIARDFNVSARDLRSWNNIKENDVLKSGKVLVIY
jgi:LysM repeat protein